MIKVLKFIQFDICFERNYTYPEHLQVYAIEAWMRAMSKVEPYYDEYKDVRGWPPCSYKKMKQTLLRHIRNEHVKLAFESYWLSEELITVIES